MKLIIGNRAYSSWSLRGWLALRHSGLEFEELVVPLYDEAGRYRFLRRMADREAAPVAESARVVHLADHAVAQQLNRAHLVDDRAALRREREHGGGVHQLTIGCDGVLKHDGLVVTDALIMEGFSADLHG